MSETNTESRGRRNQLLGQVVSDKMDKTIVVEVYRQVRHPRLGKIIKRSRKFKAHDERNEAQYGDKVLIHESRALSKTKRWKLEKIVERDERLRAE